MSNRYSEYEILSRRTSDFAQRSLLYYYVKMRESKTWEIGDILSQISNMTLAYNLTHKQHKKSVISTIAIL